MVSHGLRREKLDVFSLNLGVHRARLLLSKVWMHGEHEDMEHMALEPIKKGCHASMPSMHMSKCTRQGPSPYALGLSPHL